MNKTPIQPFFNSTVQSKVETLINEGFENFKGFELEIAGGEYLFEKISHSYIGFFTYLMDNDFKSYFFPIAIFNEKSEVGLYPLYDDFFNDKDYPTKLKIKSIGAVSYTHLTLPTILLV